MRGLGERSGAGFLAGSRPRLPRAPHRAPPCPWAQAGGGAWRRASAGWRGSYSTAHRGAPSPAATRHGGSAEGTGPRRTPGPGGPGGPRRRPAQTRNLRRRRGPRGQSAAPAPPRTRRRSSSGQSAARCPRPRRRLPWQQLCASQAAEASFPTDQPTNFPPP